MCVQKLSALVVLSISLLFIAACRESPKPNQTAENVQNGPALQPVNQTQAANSANANQTLTVAQETPLQEVVPWEPGSEEEATAVAETQSLPANSNAGLNILAIGSDGCQRISDLAAQYSETETAVTCREDINGYSDFSYRIGTADADLIVLPTSWWQQAAYDNSVQDLTHFLQAYSHLESIPPAFLPSLEFPEGAGQLYGVPLQPDVHMLVLRQDLLAEAGLTNPASWQELLTQVQTLQAKGQPGFVSAWCENPACTENITAVWQEISWSVGGTLWDAPNKQAVGVLNSVENQTALALLNSLQGSSPNTANFTMADAVNALCEGSASVGLVWVSNGRALADPACAQAGNLSFVPLPGSDLVLGGSTVGVTPTAVHQEEALNFINWLMSADSQQALNSAAQNEVLSESLGKIRTSKIPPEYQSALNTQIPVLRQAILGQLTAQEALDTMAAHQQNVLDNLYIDG